MSVCFCLCALSLVYYCHYCIKSIRDLNAHTDKSLKWELSQLPRLCQDGNFCDMSRHRPLYPGTAYSKWQHNSGNTTWVAAAVLRDARMLERMWILQWFQPFSDSQSPSAYNRTIQSQETRRNTVSTVQSTQRDRYIVIDNQSSADSYVAMAPGAASSTL